MVIIPSSIVPLFSNHVYFSLDFIRHGFLLSPIKSGLNDRDIPWLDYAARLREELRDELPGP